MSTASKHLLIFCKNPVLGQCKTRLAASIGAEKALAVYEFLLTHTAKITAKVQAKRVVHYSNYIQTQDAFSDTIFNKAVQSGSDLGQRMAHALEEAFDQGATKAILIGSDLYDLSAALIESAFEALNDHDAVIGPASDGGYYLIGMNQPISEIFNNKYWGTPSVLSDTLTNLTPYKTAILVEKNDIDTLSDLESYDVFKALIR